MVPEGEDEGPGASTLVQAPLFVEDRGSLENCKELQGVLSPFPWSVCCLQPASLSRHWDM